MLQVRSILDVADNTGAKRAAAIGVLGRNQRYAHIGDIIKAHIKALENLDELLDRFLVFGQTTTSIVQSSPVPQRGLPIPVSRGARKISRKGAKPQGKTKGTADER